MKSLREYGHIWFLGIGGIGMSAIARCCQLWGISVSGYDRTPSAITDALSADGAVITFDDDPSTVSALPDLVIYTPAIPADSRLKAFFAEAGITMVKRSEALETLTKGIDTIAVAGTHGKTTTSSMISYVLHSTGLKHTAILGGIAVNFRSNFHSESLDRMVVEADEYDRSFWRLFPKWTVVTAMDPDHLDIYGTYEEMLNGYRQFIRQIQPGGVLIHKAGLQEKIGEAVLDELRQKDVSVYSYGLGQGDFHAEDLRVEDGLWKWNLYSPDGKVLSLAMQMPGRHNVENATAACAIAIVTGAEPEKIERAMPGYKGVSRRFEIHYRDSEHILIDDYAHHPEELVAAITAARETYGGPLTGIFQPHLYSRTRDFAKEFAAALDLLDVPVLVDIYPARELPIEGVSSQTIFDLMQNPKKQWLRGDSWKTWVIEQKPEILMILGAGDIDKHIPDLIGKLYKE